MLIFRAFLALLGAVALSTVISPRPETPGAAADEPTFAIRVVEDHPQESTNPVIYFRAQTVEQQPCANYTISTTLTVGIDSVDVWLGAIVKPEVCLTAIGPPSSQVALSAPEGSYVLAIRSDLGIDSYELTITPDSIRLTAAQSSFTVPREAVFYRYPVNSFAYYCGSLVTDSYLCQDLGDRLTSQLPLEQISFPPEGTWPYEAISQGHYYDMPAVFFRYPDAATWEQARAVFEQFVNGTLGNRCGASVWLINWRSDWLRSWMMVQPSCEGVIIPTAKPSPDATPGEPPRGGGAPPKAHSGAIPIVMVLAGTVALAIGWYAMSRPGVTR